MKKNKAGVFFSIVPILVFHLAAFDSRQNQAQRVLRHDAAAVIKLVPVRVLDAGAGPSAGSGKKILLFMTTRKSKRSLSSKSTSRVNRASRQRRRT